MTDLNLEEVLKQLADHERRIGSLEKDESSHQKPDSKVMPSSSGDLVLQIINKVGDCEESSSIQTNILDAKANEPKILLCFYMSSKYFSNAWLTTGIVEKITSGLGVKIPISTVSTVTKFKLSLYLESAAVRKNGQPTPYRLNRNGMKRFEELLHAKTV